MLRARGLVIRYGPRTAVAGVDLELGDHEILGLLGPNGAGKSTLLRRLAGLLHAQAGSVELDGADPVHDPGARARIGYLPEDPPLYAEDTALQYVAYLAALSGLPRTRRTAAARAALDRVGAGPLEQRLCGRLSKGQRQRVAMAAAIVHDPDVLLLDEPSEGLDPRQMAGLRTLLGELRTTTSIVVSTHLLAEAQSVCDRVVVLDQGRVALERRLGANGTGHRVRVVAHGVKPGQLNDALLAVPGVRAVERGVCAVDGPAVSEAIATMVCAHGWRLRVLAPVPDDLEAAFLAAVTQAPPSRAGERT
ncbi:MAG TPA: ABC transporter ATP-binding protein [Candidatus Dormibacteraeota bacterium]|jgi:ABC-2 type transport system ATP-binding protein|nr:ABC transporter ATP-binding protein [Candidatus Dormibacteraeota bacterium]